MRQPFGGGFTFFVIFNSLMEWLVVRVAVFLNWSHPRRRTLLLTCAILFYLSRVDLHLLRPANIRFHEDASRSIIFTGNFGLEPPGAGLGGPSLLYGNCCRYLYLRIQPRHLLPLRSGSIQCSIRSEMIRVSKSSSLHLRQNEAASGLVVPWRWFRPVSNRSHAPRTRFCGNPAICETGLRLPDKRDHPVVDFFHVGVVAFQFPLQKSLLEYAPHRQHRNGNDCQQSRNV